jgi:hypothetical protein
MAISRRKCTDISILCFESQVASVMHTMSCQLQASTLYIIPPVTLSFVPNHPGLKWEAGTTTYRIRQLSRLGEGAQMLIVHIVFQG